MNKSVLTKREWKEWNKKYKQTLENLNLTKRKDEKRLVRIKLERKFFIIRAQRYNWAIANLVPHDKRDEAKSNAPKEVFILAEGTDEYMVLDTVRRHFGRTLNRLARSYSCMLLSSVVTKYPIYYVTGNIEIDIVTDAKEVEDKPIINFVNPEKVNKERPYKWRSNPKENTLKYFGQKEQLVIEYKKRTLQKELRVHVKKSLPKFYKDKVITLHNTEENIIVRVRKSALLEHDSPYSLNRVWKRGYPKFKKQIKTPKTIIKKDIKLKKPL